jgi:hypothetical protein
MLVYEAVRVARALQVEVLRARSNLDLAQSVVSSIEDNLISEIRYLEGDLRKIHFYIEDAQASLDRARGLVYGYEGIIRGLVNREYEDVWETNILIREIGRLIRKISSRPLLLKIIDIITWSKLLKSVHDSLDRLSTQCDYLNGVYQAWIEIDRDKLINRDSHELSIDYRSTYLTISQWISLLTFIDGIVAYEFILKYNKYDYEDLGSIPISRMESGSLSIKFPEISIETIRNIAEFLKKAFGGSSYRIDQGNQQIEFALKQAKALSEINAMEACGDLSHEQADSMRRVIETSNVYIVMNLIEKFEELRRKEESGAISSEVADAIRVRLTAVTKLPLPSGSATIRIDGEEL